MYICSEEFTKFRRYFVYQHDLTAKDWILNAKLPCTKPYVTSYELKCNYKLNTYNYKSIDYSSIEFQTSRPTQYNKYELSKTTINDKNRLENGKL